MAQRGESSDTTPAEVLAAVPDEMLPIFEQILALTDPQLQPLVAEVFRIVPHDILLSIMRTKPDSKVKVTEYIDDSSGDIKHVRFASYIKRRIFPVCLDDVDWAIIMGIVANQLDHDICWAVVARDLIRAVRLINGRDTDPNIEYSVQDLIDFTDPVQRRQVRNDGHYCYTSSINRGMRYVMENGIQREEDRPFTGCPQYIPDRVLSGLGYIKDFKRIDTIEEALLQLKHQPIGAAVAMFFPEYNEIGENIYRGPVLQRSRLVGLHAVSLVAADEENGEKYVVARSSHGDKFGKNGYMKISIDIMLVYVPTPGEEINTKANTYFAEPSPLLRRFSYPRLLSREEEERRKKRHGASKLN
ncbi:unnamed protein product [Arabidopsis lyrata]|nr:unnamed protein product [Arabidopsis lyrata]